MKEEKVETNDVCRISNGDKLENEQGEEGASSDGIDLQRPSKRIKQGNDANANANPIDGTTLDKNVEASNTADTSLDITDTAATSEQDPRDILSPTLQSQKETIQKSYSTAEPYPYAQIFDMFDPDFLNAVKDEIKTQTTVSFKESDLFRVYQSIDLANLDPQSLQAKTLKNVMRLRQLLYSQELRTFMEEVTGLAPGTLTNQIDCACNCHAPGCHLLCHDDVIGTRKISYIIYLTEPDWKPEEGGALELYNPQLDDDDSDSNSTAVTKSLPIPVKRAWPVFNSMAFFVVTPGSSFHAVQEVLGDRPRLSLQGWFHAKDPPPNMELATLQQLKSKKDSSLRTTSPSKKVEAAEEDNTNTADTLDEFTEEDREYLKRYIQPEFLSEEGMKEIQERFENDSSAQLKNFLKPTWVPKLQPSKSFVYDESYYSSGVTKEWTLQGPAHKQRYLKYKHDDSASDDTLVVGSLLNHVKVNVFESDAMKKYLGFVTALGNPTGINSSEIRQFRPGLDYTVAHHGLLVDESVLDATMCFVHDENDGSDAWESGDVGGFECYIEAEDSDTQSSSGPADEYSEDDDTELLSVSASNNTLSLVYRDPGTMRFVKYIGSSAPSGRFDICMEYSVVSEDDDEAEEEEAAEEEEDADSST
ncbi:Oxoglutarate and iron-dependent oxygenase degradation domain containing protein [Nitzschia inconspicua]|uniref:Oxoglutarate and iron-dependent oxygenase degradation domain containing protein n=1 Tax=Nitzschia inconspicua TaxID=303405 RepID=A0A9K3Q1K5_9STRA|nr:Oxoglutarate and iron-dependent oxygenase degradation domain containing protein [Nitzschia inconspicua]